VLAASSLERLAESYPVDVRWRSFELRPKGGPPISPEYRARIEANRPRLYAMAREQYGLELKQGPFGIDSRPSLIGAKYAEALGQGPAYHRAMFHAYWLDGRSIEDLATLRELAAQVGLDADAFEAALGEPAYLQAVLDDIALAQEFGITAVPTMIFGNKYLVQGAQPYETLVQVVERVRSEQG
jgi:predicted DsbA family dithiol-disulfide isomerase